uniref:Polyketide synthase n=1 Tax=uncultured bacterium AZ_379 TaxID=1630015 RepID=A0A0E3JNQ1_9BACT|nr:polyketide synthase [uncultured bacterium AZ_379]
MTNTDGIAIVGMACRFPGAGSLEEYWANLRSGADTISRFTADELAAAGVDPGLVRHPDYVPARGILQHGERFDWTFFGYSPAEAATIDPQHRVFLECASVALDDAAIDPLRFKGWIGVFAGCDVQPGYAVDGDEDGIRRMIGHEKDFLATRAAYKLGLRGPALTVQTACSTSLVAVHLACQSLFAFECDAALAGGVAIWLPQTVGYRYRDGGILSRDGTCRPFDADASGTVSASGVGIVVLKRLTDALSARDRIVAVIRGSAVNNDGGEKIGYTAPSITGQRDVIRLAVAQAGVNVDDIGYVEAHGTGTRVGDPVEVAALAAAFGETNRRVPCWLGAVKSNIGHTGAAAGVAGIIKTACMLDRRELLPTAHFRRPNPLLRLDETPFRVCAEWMPWASSGPLLAGVSSFGIGGTNAHAVLESPPAVVSGCPERNRSWVYCFSANTPEAMAQLRARLASRLASESAPSPHDVAWTLATGRRRFAYRQAYIASDIPQLADRLRNSPAAPVRAGGLPPVIFLFPGQGTFQIGAGRAAYDLLPEFRVAVDEARGFLLHASRPDVVPGLRGDADPAWAIDTEHQQLALFVLGYALARQLHAWGIRPAAMLGHSIGEYVAATVAGLWTLPDALAIVSERARAMRDTAPGRMVAAPAPVSELGVHLREDPALAISVEDSGHTVISGPVRNVERLVTSLQACGISAQLVATERAFHSPLMQPACDALRRAVAATPSHAPGMRYVSNLTGAWVDADLARTPDYWTRHLCETVRLSTAIETLLTEPGCLFLELGPGETMIRALRVHPRWRERAGTAVATLGRSRDLEREHLLQALGALWERGADIDWDSMLAPLQPRRCSLPAHPLDSRTCGSPAPDARRRARAARKSDEPQVLVNRWTQTEEAEAGDHEALLLIRGTPEPTLEPLWALLGRSSSDRQPPATVSGVPWDRGRVELALAEMFEHHPESAAVAALVSDTFTLNLLDDLEWVAARVAAAGATLYVVARGVCDVLGGEAVRPESSALLAWFEHRQRSTTRGRAVLLDVGAGDMPPRLPRLAEPAALSAWRGSRWWALTRRSVELGTTTARAPAQSVALLTWGHDDPTELAVDVAGRGWHVGALAALDVGGSSRLRPSDVAARLTWSAGAARLSARPDLAARLDRYAAALVARFVMERPGVGLGSRLSREELRRRIDPDARLPRLADFLVTLLLTEGWLRSRDGEIQVSRSLEDAVREIDRHEAGLEELRGLCGILRHCAAAYPDVFSGRSEPLAVLYADGGELLRTSLEDNHVRIADAGACLDALVQAIRAAASGRRHFRILEVGGGHGAFASRLFDNWNDCNGVSYHFTDVSPLFVNQARERMAAAGVNEVHFGTLDITRDPVEQGFPAGAFDAIVGYNVIHVAPSLSECIARLGRLLAPDGWLCLVELTKASPWVHMVWGLAPGWWNYNDGLRRDSPHLDAAAWARLLRETGFGDVVSVPSRGDADHRLLLATKPALRSADAVDRVVSDLRRCLSQEDCRDLLLVPKFLESTPDDAREAMRRLASLLAHPSGPVARAWVVSQDTALSPDWLGQVCRRTCDPPPHGVAWRHVEVRTLGEAELALLRGVLASPALPSVLRLETAAAHPDATEAMATSPGSLEASDTTPRAAPGADAVRSVVERVWCDVLGVPAAADSDDFFHCGGDSLIVLSLVSRIQDRLGSSVPVAAFMKEPTFRHLVDLARPRESAGSLGDNSIAAAARDTANTAPDLVVLHEEGALTPLFLMSPAAASSLCYRHLVSHLAPRQPCFGLESPGLQGESRPLARIEQIAAHHIRIIRHVRPRGPYVVGGWSTGALVAHEVAHQLTAQGEIVEQVVLIDGYVPPSGGRPLGTVPECLVAGLWHWAKAGSLRADGVEAAMWGFFRNRGATRLTGRVSGEHRSSAMADVYRATVRAMLRYRPRPVPCPAVLFKTELTPVRRHRLERRLMPLYGGGIEVRSSSGSHLTILEGRHAAELALGLSEVLARLASNAEREVGRIANTDPNDEALAS